MNLRIVLLGTIWFGVMLLLFFSPVKEPQTIYFWGIPSKSIIHGLLFWGFAHIWSATLKKQLKYEFLKTHTLKIVLVGSLVIAILIESIIFMLAHYPHFSFWNLFFDVLGICGGLVSFRLLYAKCY